MALSFVADENVESDVVVALRELGHDVVDVAHSSPGAADDSLLESARSRNAILITSDKDFGDLVYRQRKMTAGVVLMRLAGLSPQLKAQHVTAAVGQHESELLGSFTVIARRSVRVRVRGCSRFESAGQRAYRRREHPTPKGSAVVCEPFYLGRLAARNDPTDRGSALKGPWGTVRIAHWLSWRPAGFAIEVMSAGSGKRQWAGSARDRNAARSNLVQSRSSLWSSRSPIRSGSSSCTCGRCRMGRTRWGRSSGLGGTRAAATRRYESRRLCQPNLLLPLLPRM